MGGGSVGDAPWYSASHSLIIFSSDRGRVGGDGRSGRILVPDANTPLASSEGIPCLSPAPSGGISKYCIRSTRDGKIHLHGTGGMVDALLQVKLRLCWRQRAGRHSVGVVSNVLITGAYLIMHPGRVNNRDGVLHCIY